MPYSLVFPCYQLIAVIFAFDILHRHQRYLSKSAGSIENIGRLAHSACSAFQVLHYLKAFGNINLEVIDALYLLWMEQVIIDYTKLVQFLIGFLNAVLVIIDISKQHHLVSYKNPMVNKQVNCPYRFRSDFTGMIELCRELNSIFSKKTGQFLIYSERKC